MEIQKLYSIYLDFPQVCTDTRKVLPNSMFFALKGDNFNGNKFAQKALDSGCSYAIVDEPIDEKNPNIILVPDVLETLQNLANYHRNQIDLTVIAVTGSNGKTTTKELAYEVLQSHKKTFKTPGNFNNHIGLPLSLLKIEANTDIAILEMGDSVRGDVELLCQIAEPNYGLITNIGKDHIGGFGSMENNILAKKEIIDYLVQSGGTFFMNDEDPMVTKLVPSNLNTLHYGSSLIELASPGPLLNFKVKGTTYSTQLFGDYNIHNIRLAYIMGKTFGVDESTMLSAIINYTPKSNRSELVKTDKNTLILDAYNANPSSVEVALDSFAKIQNASEAWVILGDMLELGEISNHEHQSIANKVAELGFQQAVFIGAEYYQTEHFSSFHYFSEKEEAVDFIKNKSIDSAQILLKGSRGLQLETLVDLL